MQFSKFRMRCNSIRVIFRLRTVDDVNAQQPVRPPGDMRGAHPDGKECGNSKGKSSSGQPSLNAPNFARPH